VVVLHHILIRFVPKHCFAFRDASKITAYEPDQKHWRDDTATCSASPVAISIPQPEQKLRPNG
jgi:hypothetical protein